MYKRTTNAKDGMPRPEVDAGREDRTFCKWVNGKAAINGAATVLTDAGLIMPILDGYRYFIACLFMNVDTASDTLAVDLVCTQGADGSGIVTAISPQFHISTGVAADGRQPQLTAINPPIALTHKDGYHAVTFRAQTNDAGAEATLGFTGWYEEE